MSNRYVWQRFNLAYTANYSPMTVKRRNFSSGGFTNVWYGVPGYTFDEWTGGPGGGLSKPVYAAVASSFTMSGNKFKLTNPTVTESEYDDDSGFYDLSVPITTLDSYFYFVTSDSSISGSTTFSEIYRVKATPASRTIHANIFTGNSYGNSQPCLEFYFGSMSLGAAAALTFERMTAVGTKGSLVGTVSNSASSTYPQDGISGNYWYTYQGSDSIDATAVGYSNQAPMGGQPITINVTPRTPTYGGTIRYTYQVQLSGGAWQTISSNDTATSLQYTIPAGTTSFAARVRASDTWGFSSSDYTTGATLTVTNNLPPSAPDGITIGDVLGGQQCTITWGAATDSDGTIDHYELERQVDNGDTWTQIFSGNALTYNDTINSEWATVNYRVRAVDDDAEPGPYTTGTMQTVNAGWLYFSGPAADMGDKPAPFDFVFSIGSTTEGVTDISVEVLLDDEIIYTGTPDAAEQVSVHIDTRLMFAGEHVLVITAEKQNLLGLDQECTFTVPAVTLPDGGRMVQLYNDEGQPVFPLTLGRAVIGKGGEDVNEILDRVFSGTYTGTGTSGSQNPCQLRLSFVPRFMFVYSNGATPASGWWVRTADATTSAQGTMETTGGTATVTWDNDNMTLSWYASSAAVQLNTSGTVYGYLVIG